MGSARAGKDSEGHDEQKGLGGRSGAGDGAGSLPRTAAGSDVAAHSTRGSCATPRTTRRFVVLAVAIGGATALLVVAQAFLIATVVAGAFVDHRSAASLRDPARRPARRRGGPRRPGLGRRARGAPGLGIGQVGAAPRRGHPRRRARPAGPRRPRHGSAQRAPDDGRRRPRRLLLPLPAPAVPGRHRAGHDHRRRGGRGLGERRADRGQPSPDPALHGARRRRHAGTARAARMRSLQKLAGHFLDVVAGLPTLKVFGRAKAQARSIADVTDRYRSATMATLRLTFLSSLILELLATVSVALVAVAVGLRLLGGHMTFDDALFVLVLAPGGLPAVARPRRQLPRQRRRDEGGRGDLRAPRRHPGPGPAAGSIAAAGTAIRIAGLDVTYPGRRLPALHDADLVVEPGETVALTGPSGCGKSTLLSVVLGLRLPRRRDGHARRRRPRRPRPRPTGAATSAWVPQRPHLFARSVAENVRLGRPDASDADGRGRARRRRVDRGRAAAPPRRRHAPGRGRRRPVGRRAAAPRAGAGLRARRAAPPARRADRQPRQRDGGGRARRRSAGWSAAAPR